MAEPTLKMLIDQHHEDAGELASPDEPLHVIGYEVQKTNQNGEAVYYLWQVIAEIADITSLSDLRSIPFHKFLMKFAYKYDEVTSTFINVSGRNIDEKNYIRIGVFELFEMGIKLSSIVDATHWLIEDYLAENEITREQLKHQVDANLREFL